MKRGRSILLGSAIGIAAALILIEGASLRPRDHLTGPMLGEHGGAIRSVVMQYTSGSAALWPVFKPFLQQQTNVVNIYLACPGPADFAEFQQAVGPTRCTIVPIFTGHAMTSWSRDRWVELLPARPSEAATLLAPKGELQQEIWPQRAGDSHVAEDLAKALRPAVAAHRSDLYFDGGDLLCDGPWVFVTPAVLQRNLQHTVTTRDRLVEMLEHDLQRKVIILDGAPDHHAGMYMMAAGNGRMLVGDPSLGSSLFDANTPVGASLEGGPDFTSQTQSRFDAVAAIAAAHGYRVTRIPTVPAANGKMYLTFVNVIMDERGGRPIVYMPIFAGQSKMNAAAQRIWESLGYEVIPIDCTSVWHLGGTLHCLVNVLERG